MYEKDKINNKSGSCHQTFQNFDIFQNPDCFGSFRDCSVCFVCFDTGSKHRNKPKKKIFGFTKQTETNAKQILFRFVSVRTEKFFFSFRGHPRCDKGYDGSGRVSPGNSAITTIQYVGIGSLEVNESSVHSVRVIRCEQPEPRAPQAYSEL